MFGEREKASVVVISDHDGGGVREVNSILTRQSQSGRGTARGQVSDAPGDGALVLWTVTGLGLMR